MVTRSEVVMVCFFLNVVCIFLALIISLIFPRLPEKELFFGMMFWAFTLFGIFCNDLDGKEKLKKKQEERWS